MLPARLALVAAALAVAPVSLGCVKKPPPPAVVVEDTPPPSDGAGAPGEGDGGDVEAEPAKQPQRKPPGKPVHVRATLHAAGDLMTLVKQVTVAWTPKQPIDPAAQIQSILLQMGYAPGLWSNLDLAGPFALDATFFPQEPSVDLKLVGSLAAVSAKGIMEGMPSAQRPQPLGNGLWELIQGDLRILLREQPRALEFALSPPDLDRAAGLAAEGLKGRRLQIRGWDLPPGLLDGNNLGSLPPGLRRQVSAVLRDTKSAAIELDAGTDRDLALQLSAEAPFSRLGLSPLGPARTQPTALEGLLPSAPILVVAMPWGSPETLHAVLDKGVRLDQIPAPFDKVARDAIGGAHAILDQLTSDVVLAVYFTPKGEATLAVAANVKDEAAARAAVRQIEDAAAKGLEAFNALTGDDKSAKIGVTYKTDGVKAGAVKADLLSLAVPKNAEKEAADLAPFLAGKKKLEAVTLVSGQLAVMTIGAGAQKLAADIAGGLKSARKTSLTGDAGLRLARLASQGCHFCVSVDPTALVRLSALLDADERQDKARMKEIEAASATFARVGGAVGLGLKLDPNLGSLAVGLPRAILVLSPADAAQLGKLWESPAAPAADDKPLARDKKSAAASPPAVAPRG